MSKILIVFGTSYGQTEKIARRLGSLLQDKDHVVEICDTKRNKTSFSLNKYDGVIVGASVHAGHYQRLLKKWVKKNSEELEVVPTAFFSVSLGVLQDIAKVQFELKKANDDFFKACHWYPQTQTTFAGGLAYSQYNPLLRWWMKRIAKKAGGDTDTSKDYEYTNWDDVNIFANEFEKQLSSNLGPRKLKVQDSRIKKTPIEEAQSIF